MRISCFPRTNYNIGTLPLMMAPLSDARRGNKDYHEVTITHTKKTNSKISFKVAIYVQVNLQVL